MDNFIGTGNLGFVNVDVLLGLNFPLTLTNLESAELFADLDLKTDVLVICEFSEVPVPAALWLFMPSLIGLLAFRQRSEVRILSTE